MFSFLKKHQKTNKKTHTGRHIEKQWRLLLFHSTKKKKKCCDIRFNHWAETNIHTVPLKWRLAQRTCKAWGRLGHVHTRTHVLTWAAAHAHTSSFFIYISYLTHIWLLVQQPYHCPSPPMCSVREARGQGSPSDSSSLLLPFVTG